MPGLTLSNWQITYGKQSEWWGPDQGGPMMFSNNAEPINMFRINRVTPFKLPSLLGLLGPIRVEFFVGQLSGHHFVNTSQPVRSARSPRRSVPSRLSTGKRLVSSRLRNVEFGFTRTTIFAGELRLSLRTS